MAPLPEADIPLGDESQDPRRLRQYAEQGAATRNLIGQRLAKLRLAQSKLRDDLKRAKTGVKPLPPASEGGKLLVRPAPHMPISPTAHVFAHSHKTDDVWARTTPPKQHDLYVAESQQRIREEASEARRKALDRIRANREASGVPIKLNAQRGSRPSTPLTPPRSHAVVRRSRGGGGAGARLKTVETQAHGTE